MSGPRDHGVFTIRLALFLAPWVNMYISHYREAFCFTNCPQIAEVAPIESDYSTVEAMRVQIVVENKVDNPKLIAVPVAK